MASLPHGTELRVAYSGGRERSRFPSRRVFDPNERFLESWHRGLPRDACGGAKPFTHHCRLPHPLVGLTVSMPTSISPMCPFVWSV